MINQDSDGSTLQMAERELLLFLPLAEALAPYICPSNLMAAHAQPGPQPPGRALGLASPAL